MEPFVEDLIAAYYCALDPATPTRVRAMLLAALAYFILPFDFIPDMLPVIGFADDAALLAATIALVSSHITPAHRAAAARALDKELPKFHSILEVCELAERSVKCHKRTSWTWRPGRETGSTDA
jgi:uncharacterized membrane protein YkvA (DUF1232 family)